MINWNKTAIKEQQKLEQEQEDLLLLADVLANEMVYFNGRKFGKTFMCDYMLWLAYEYGLIKIPACSEV